MRVLPTVPAFLGKCGGWKNRNNVTLAGSSTSSTPIHTMRVKQSSITEHDFPRKEVSKNTERDKTSPGSMQPFFIFLPILVVKSPQNISQSVAWKSWALKASSARPFSSLLWSAPSSGTIAGRRCHKNIWSNGSLQLGMIAVVTTTCWNMMNYVHLCSACWGVLKSCPWFTACASFAVCWTACTQAYPMRDRIKWQ